MRLTIAYSKIKKRNLVLINNDTYQRETLSERPILVLFSKIKDKCKTFMATICLNQEVGPTPSSCQHPRYPPPSKSSFQTFFLFIM